MPVDNIDDEGLVVTIATIETSKPSPSPAVPVVTTSAPIDIEEPPFQPVTADIAS